MLPDADKVIGCPHCHKLLRVASWLSWNTLGCAHWSDGKIEGPHLPDTPVVTRCAHCNDYFWIEDADLLGTCEDPFSEKSVSQQHPRGEWETAPEVRQLDADELVKALNVTKDPERYTYLLKRLWHICNDRYRTGSVKENVELVPKCRAIIEELSDSVSIDTPEGRLIFAETLRQLGQFSEAAKWAIRLIEDLAAQDAVGLSTEEAEELKEHAEQTAYHANKHRNRVFPVHTGSDEISRLKRFARQGDDEAQFLLGCRYRTGYGVPKDRGKALKLFVLAADQGNAWAATNAGILLTEGDPGEPDLKKSITYFEKAIALGDPLGLYYMAEYYRQGVGIEKNISRSIELYRQAAMLGYDPAKYQLGASLITPNAAPEELAEGIRWIQEAANNDHFQAANLLGYCLQNGIGVPQDYKAGFERFMNCATAGSATGMYNVGYAYRQGWGVEKDHRLARQWFEKAAHAGEVAAQYYMGIMCRDGFGGPRDFEESARWFRLASEEGDIYSMNCLGAMYALGKGVEQDYGTSFDLYSQAAEGGYAVAQYNLGNYYYLGQGVDRDLDLALHWLRRAESNGHHEARNRISSVLESIRLLGERKELAYLKQRADDGESDAQYNLARMCLDGTGMEEDLDAAKRWLRLAAEQGHVRAAIDLSKLETDASDMDD